MPKLPDDFSEAILDQQCLALVLSKRKRGADELVDRVALRPVVIRDQPQYQLTSRHAGRESHENLSPRAAAEKVNQLFGETFLHCHLYTPQADQAARVRKNGSIKVTRSAPTKAEVSAAHDRSRNYLIPEDEPCEFLAEIGVMTGAGRVKASRRAKFRQVNRFLELVNDIIPALPAEGPLRIVDFGCGKSYLTFALHHLLTRIHDRKVQILGLDRNADVVADCTRIAEKLGCEGLEFRQGDISTHETDGPVDLAVSLHACDTATDESIGKAVAWQARALLAVPCCQHEIAPQLNSQPLTPVLQHGILRERLAAIATDALRAEALEICGYSTQVVEFIDMEHTAKNLLIRAVRRGDDGAPGGRDRAAYRELKSLLGIEQFALEPILQREAEIDLTTQAPQVAPAESSAGT